jgi:hypothetical protein
MSTSESTPAHYHGATLCQSRPEPFAIVDFIPQSGTQDVASVCDVFLPGEDGRPGDGAFIQLGWPYDSVLICYGKQVMLCCTVFTHRVKAVGHGVLGYDVLS